MNDFPTRRLLWRLCLLLAPAGIAWVLSGDGALGAAGLALGMALLFAIRPPARPWRVFLIYPLLVPLPRLEEIIDQLVEMANIARRDGMLALERLWIAWPALSTARDHCVDGVDPPSLEAMLKQERRRVLAQIVELRAAVWGIACSLSAMELFLWLAKEWSGAAIALFLTVLFGIGLLARLQDAAREVDALYRTVTLGMKGIQLGVNPRILEAHLRDGSRFAWVTLADSAEEVERKDDYARQVALQLETYLRDVHPQVRRIDLALPVLDRQGQARQFHFSHLAGMDDRSMQILLREVSNDEIVLALRATNPELIRRMTRNMSDVPASDILRRMEWMKMPEVNRIEKAQATFLQVARQLEAQGAIVILEPSDWQTDCLQQDRSPEPHGGS